MTDAAFDWYGPDTATFGDRLAAARDATNMTQWQLAKRLGIKVATLKAWEGDLSEPRANRLSMLAGLLNVSITWLINGEGEGVDSPEETLEISQEMSDLLIELLNPPSKNRLIALVGWKSSFAKNSRIQYE